MVRVSGTRPSVWFNRIVKDTERYNADDMGQAGVYGRDKMKEYISTRATQWGREVMGREGRIESGDMLRAVGYRDGKFGATGRRVEIGWITDRQDYYRYQERGFNNKRTGKWVQGMFALQDAVEDTIRFLDRKLRARGIRKR